MPVPVLYSLRLMSAWMPTTDGRHLAYTLCSVSALPPAGWSVMVTPGSVGAVGSSFLPVTVVSSSVSSRGSVTLPCWPGSPSTEMESRPRPAHT